MSFMGLLTKQKISMRKRKLGKWQVAALEDIFHKRVCCDLKILAKVGGAAAKWDRKYKRSLLSAVEAHNLCVALNSPVDPQLVILLEGCGYVLVNRSSVPRYASYSY